MFPYSIGFEAGPGILISDCKIGFRGHGIALAIEVMVSMISGWWMMKLLGSLKLMRIGCLDPSSSSEGEMILMISPVTVSVVVEE